MCAHQTYVVRTMLKIIRSLSLILFVACANLPPKPVCSPPPVSVAFENQGAHANLLSYGDVSYLLPAAGRIELVRSAAEYQIGSEVERLPSGPVDSFGTLHVVLW